MEPETQFPDRTAFGPFEVNSATGELRRHGVRVRLSGQPYRILMTLLAHPGELVTREQLRQQVWSEATFVDFEHGLNAAMNKLRRALGDAAENPRYIETHPGLGYRFIGTLAGPGPVHAPSQSESHVYQASAGRRRMGIRWLLASAILCLLSFAFGLWFRQPPAPPPLWKITRLTADAGLSYAPAISPDGKLVAYSSDRGLEGERDLYVKQVTGGQPIRLTFDGEGNTTPDFSSDGGKIVFRSNREGGGIYEIPTFGGDVRLIARDGLNPKFSPDGSQVAYWVGAGGTVAAAVPGTGTVWVVPAAGGQPQRVGSQFTTARVPIWFPDGKHLLVVGYTSEKAYDNSSIDWWLVSTKGGEAVRTGAYEALVRAGLQASDPASSAVALTPLPPSPACWSTADNAVVFSVASGATQNLWEIGLLARTGKVNGLLKRLTTGAGNKVDPACSAGGAVLFTNIENRRGIWSLPFDLNRGTPKGPLERITQGPAHRDSPSLSNNGRYLVFSSDQSGQPNIWMRDTATGQEFTLARSPFMQGYPVSNASGSKVAFSVYEKDKRVVYAVSPGGEPDKICEGCLQATNWSSDERTLLVFSGSPYQVNAVDVVSHRQTPLLKHPQYSLLYARFSPDEHWVSFTARTQPNRGRILIAPVDGPKPVPESAWIPIAEVGADDRANWSPDGNLLYFSSGRDRHNCLWGQRIAARTHKPVGEAFAVQHFHGRVSFGRGWSAGGDQIGLALVEATGNVWMMSR